MSTESTAPVSAPVPSPSPAPEAPQLDSRLANLAKREREIQKQMDDLKKERQGLVPKSELGEMWKTNRSKLRELLGASPEELPDNTTASPPDPYKTLKDELDALKQEAADKDHASAVKEAKHNVKSFLEADKDAYELIHAFDGADMVFDYMVDHYKEHQETLDFKTAAEHVENHLLDQVKRVTGTKKISSMFAPKSENQPKEPGPTLTGATVTSPSAPANRRLSPEESIAEAAKLIKWT